MAFEADFGVSTVLEAHSMASKARSAVLAARRREAPSGECKSGVGL